jgi:hypothetical protein
LAQNFGGLSSAQATAPRAHSWITDEELAFTESGKRADFVVSEQVLYTAAFSDTASFRNPNQSVDLFGITIGPQFHLLPVSRKRPHLGLNTTFHFETQPVNVLESFKLKSGSIPLQFFLPRTKNAVAQVGPGWYNNKSFFEVGLEHGNQYGAFREFDFFSPGSSTVVCLPTAIQSIASCVQGNATITPTSQHRILVGTQGIDGLYWHNRFVIPAASKITASLENQGDFFFNRAGDNTTETRLQQTMTGKLSFQIWPSLTFSPTYQLFLFENMIQNKYIRQQGAMITFDYTFDWTNRGITDTQIRYKVPPAK